MEKELLRWCILNGNNTYTLNIFENWDKIFENKNIQESKFIICSNIFENNLLIFYIGTNNKYYLIECTRFTQLLINKENDLESQYNSIKNSLEETNEKIEINEFENLQESLNKISKKNNKKLFSNYKQEKNLNKNDSLSSCDFIFSQNIELWEEFINSSENIKAPMLQCMTNEIVDNVKSDKVKSLFLSFPFKINSYNFISNNFIELNELNLWFCPNLNDTSLNNLNNIKKLFIHHCSNVTLKIFYNIINSDSKLETLYLENINLECVKKKYEPLVTEKMWNSLYDKKSSQCLKNLFIDSQNLDKDNIQDILNNFRNIENFVMHDKVFNIINKDIRDGYNKNNLLCIENVDKTMQRIVRKSVKISSLLRDEIQMPFSDSMLHIINKNKK
jgi:hypothetical protein|uniref:Uncharacterized protein n=1 Tax=viral metagenome TaxID=1070528 RepID=A0A6C0J1Z2_9ZZZZ